MRGVFGQFWSPAQPSYTALTGPETAICERPRAGDRKIRPVLSPLNTAEFATHTAPRCKIAKSTAPHRDIFCHFLSRRKFGTERAATCTWVKWPDTAVRCNVCVRKLTKNISCLPATAIMIVYAVIHHAKLIGLYSCGCDAAEIAKRLPGSTITSCHLNASTEEGSVILASPA